MDPSLQHKIFDNGNCLSKSKLLNYHSGSLSGLESNAIEKHLLTCEMCSDAIEGMMLSKNPSFSIGEIDTKIKILTGAIAAGSFLNWKSGIAIAACVAGILFGGFWLINDFSVEQPLAENKAPLNQDKKEQNTTQPAEINKHIIFLTSANKTEGPVEDITISNSLSVEPTLASGTAEIELSKKQIQHQAGQKNNESIILEAESLAEENDIGLTMSSSSLASVPQIGQSVEEISAHTLWADTSTIGRYNNSNNVSMDDQDNEANFNLALDESFDNLKKEDKDKKILPTDYMEELLIVDYSDIYSADDKSPNEEPSISMEESIEETDALLQSTPASFENEQKFAEQSAAKKLEENRLKNAVESSYEKVLQEGLKLYKENKYNRAIAQLDLILAKYPVDHNALFYTGLSYAKIKKYNKAITILDTVYKLENTPFKADAEWQKALVLIEKGDGGKARNLLEKIILDNGYYAIFANEELEKL
ncbi:hypothetical protein OAF80_00505 [bacterium]|nr:hypothetical protein [bacterium]